MHDAKVLFYSPYSRIDVGLAATDEESSRKLHQTRDFPIILARDPKPTYMLENTLFSDPCISLTSSYFTLPEGSANWKPYQSRAPLKRLRAMLEVRLRSFEFPADIPQNPSTINPFTLFDITISPHITLNRKPRVCETSSRGEIAAMALESNSRIEYSSRLAWLHLSPLAISGSSKWVASKIRNDWKRFQIAVRWSKKTRKNQFSKEFLGGEWFSCDNLLHSLFVDDCHSDRWYQSTIVTIKQFDMLTASKFHSDIRLNWIECATHRTRLYREHCKRRHADGQGAHFCV